VWGVAFDLLALVAALTLVALGVLNLYAVGGRPLAMQQAVSVAVGLGLLVTLHRLQVRLLPIVGWVSYGTALGLLGAVELVGVQTQGARRWIGYGSLTFQPSELAKLGLLLVLAGVLGSDRPAWRRFVLALALAVPPIALTALEPDLSTATLLLALTAALLILGYVPLRFLLPLLGGVAVLLPLAIELLRPYQLARLQAFLSGSRSAEGPGWAVLQAHIALSSGGPFGLARDDPRYPLLAQYLPGRQNDLALASLVQAWGLVAGAAALLAAVIVVWRLALASRDPRTRQAGLAAAGLATLFGAEVVVSLGGNLGTLPIAGVPFPLLGLGGTSAVVHLAAVGVVLGARHDGARRRLWAPPRRVSPRPRLLRVTALSTTGVLVIFAGYGWQLQATQGAALREAGEVQMTRCIRIPAPRGTITDRHGTPLAVDAREDHVLAVPGLLRRPADLARLAGLAGGRVAELRRTLTGAGERMSVRVAVVPRATGSRVAAAALPGVVVVPSPRRVYPHGSLLAPLLGFVGVATPEDARRWAGLPVGEMVGRAGLEQQYDPILRGVDGRQCVYVDPPGRPVAFAQGSAPIPGASLRLTLDVGLQRKLTAELAAAIRRSRGDLGGAVVMDARAGQVLAMASLPSYDNNLYGPPVDVAELRGAAKARGHATLEHVTQVTAPPGSTFKIVVAAADMVHPVIPPRQVVPTGGSFTYGGHTFGNWRSFGAHNLMQAIAWSNDVYFYKLALRLGPERIHRVGTALGVGRRTGIDLPGESSGYFGSPQTVGRIGGTWYGGSTVILGIGQGYLTTTPLQAARFTAGIASGRLLTPRLGLAFGAGDSAYTALPVPKTQRLPFAGKLGPVREGMRQAAAYGTAARLRTLPVQAGGKTGSAEDPASPNGQPDSWFTAVAPLDRPLVVATSFVRGGGMGARTSGPVVAESLRYFLAHQARILATPRTQPG